MPTAGEPRRNNYGVRHRNESRVRHEIRLRCLISVFALLAPGGASVAQERAAPATPCNVVTGSLEVNDAGELARPPPTLDDCAVVEGLVAEFLAMTRGDFRRVDLIEDVPGNVRIHVGRMTPWGGSVDELPVDRRHGVTWLSDRIVVVVVETSGIAGPATTVFIADIEAGQVCEFTPWPGAADPRSLSVAEIQEVLDQRRVGEQPAPACRLGELPV